MPLGEVPPRNPGQEIFCSHDFAGDGPNRAMRLLSKKCTLTQLSPPSNLALDGLSWIFDKARMGATNQLGVKGPSSP